MRINVKETMDNAFFIVILWDEKKGIGYVTAHSGSDIRVDSGPNVEPLLMKRPQADEIILRFFMNGIKHAFVNLVNIFNFCEHCGKQLGDDGRCYNASCPDYNPIDQYMN